MSLPCAESDWTPGCTGVSANGAPVGFVPTWTRWDEPPVPDRALYAETPGAEAGVESPTSAPATDVARYLSPRACGIILVFNRIQA